MLAAYNKPKLIVFLHFATSILCLYLSSVLLHSFLLKYSSIIALIEKIVYHILLAFAISYFAKQIIKTYLHNMSLFSFKQYLFLIFSDKLFVTHIYNIIHRRKNSIGAMQPIFSTTFIF